MQHATQSRKKRNIPGENSDGVAETYSEVKTNANTQTVELADGPVPGNAVARQGVSSSKYTAFDEAEHNILVQGLEGCTSVIVVSRKGAWASHFWERPSFTSGDAKFQADVISFLNTDLGGHAADWADSATTKVFIMTPAPEANDLDGNGNPSNGNNPQKYPDQVGAITTALNTIVPGATIQTFVYQVQRNEVFLRSGAYGKAMILYSNNQNFDPDTFGDWDPAHHMYQVWTQAQLITHDDWVPCTGNSKRDGSSCPISSSSASTSSTASPTSSGTDSSTESATVSTTGSISTSAAVTSDPTSTAEAPSSTPDPTSTTPEPTPTPTEDPNKPTNLKCYGEGTANSLISFDESASTDPISKFCNAWIGDYTYEVDHVSMAQLYPIDGKSYDASTHLVQIEGIVQDYDSAKAGSDEEKAATIANCIKGLTAVVYYCDYGSGTKWGGVGLWSGQVLGIGGDTGTTTLPLGYDG